MPQQMITSKKLTIGRIAIQTSGGFITRLWLPCEAPDAPEPQPHTLPHTCFLQLEEWLLGNRPYFNLPIKLPQGTPFQAQTLQRIAAIPYGCTTTYGSLGAARAVGNICATNPLPILIPCHRVISAHHPPGNYRGGSTLKAHLLKLEFNTQIQHPEHLRLYLTGDTVV